MFTATFLMVLLLKATSKTVWSKILCYCLCHLINNLQLVAIIWKKVYCTFLLPFTLILSMTVIMMTRHSVWLLAPYHIITYFGFSLLILQADCNIHFIGMKWILTLEQIHYTADNLQALEQGKSHQIFIFNNAIAPFLFEILRYVRFYSRCAVQLFILLWQLYSHCLLSS